MKFWTSAACILAVLITPLQAGNVVFPGCYNRQYHNTIYPGSGYYGQQGAVNYYSYAPGYAAQKVVASEISVAPLIVTVPVDSKAIPVQHYGVNHYWSVQESYQQQQMIRDAVRAELRAILNPPAQAPVTVPPPPPPPAQQPQGKVTDLGVDTATPAEISVPLIASMQKHCFKCHGAVDTDLKGGLRLLHNTNQGLKLAQQTADRKWRIFAEMSVGIMPPAAQQDAKHAVPQTEQLPWFRWASGR